MPASYPVAPKADGRGRHHAPDLDGPRRHAQRGVGGCPLLPSRWVVQVVPVARSDGDVVEAENRRWRSRVRVAPPVSPGVDDAGAERKKYWNGPQQVTPTSVTVSQRRGSS
jgi:hypothetical protein